MPDCSQGLKVKQRFSVPSRVAWAPSPFSLAVALRNPRSGQEIEAEAPRPATQELFRFDFRGLQDGVDVMARRKNFSKMPTFAEMKASEEKAQQDFFASINQLEFTDEGYPCKVPVFYRKQAGILGIFPARTRALQKALPKDPGLKPVKLFPGVSPLIIFSLQSLDTDIAPYNSILVIIPIRNPDFVGYFSPLDLLPGFELVRQGLIRRKQHWFVWRIPDDSYISYKLGYDFFGMPKFAADLTWEDQGEHILYTCADQGEKILAMRARKIHAPQRGKGIEIASLAYFYRDKLPMTEECRVLVKRGAVSLRPDHLALDLGESHPMAQELREVLITTRPLCSAYLPDTNLIIYEPGRWAGDVLEQFSRFFSAKERRRKAKTGKG